MTAAEWLAIGALGVSVALAAVVGHTRAWSRLPARSCEPSRSEPGQAAR